MGLLSQFPYSPHYVNLSSIAPGQRASPRGDQASQSFLHGGTVDRGGSRAGNVVEVVGATVVVVDVGGAVVDGGIPIGAAASACCCCGVTCRTGIRPSCLPHQPRVVAVT